MDTQGSVYRLWTFSRIITEPPFIILAGGEIPSVHYIKGENNYEYNSNYNIQ